METDAKTLFTYLHKELMEYQLRFVDMSIKGAGLVLLVLGWMLTSPAARTVITTSAGAQAAVATAAVIMVTAYLLMAVRMSCVARHLVKKMDALHYLPRSYYHFRALSPKVVMSAATMTIVPACTVVAFTLFVR
jgi:hypothetical protein